MKKELFDQLLEGVREMNAIRRGEATGTVTTAADLGIVLPREVREKMQLSQSEFATVLGISTRTLQGWEQGRRKPAGAARILLLVADRDPAALMDVIKSEARARRPKMATV